MVADSPLVIPYLRQIMTLNKDAVVRALAQFPDNADAESIVLAAFRGGAITDAVTALSVLQQWRCLLSPGDFAGFMDRGTQPSRLAGLRYAGALASRTLLESVTAWTDDPEPEVAPTARRVAEALEKSGK